MAPLLEEVIRLYALTEGQELYLWSVIIREICLPSLCGVVKTLRSTLYHRYPNGLLNRDMVRRIEYCNEQRIIITQFVILGSFGIHPVLRHGHRHREVFFFFRYI